MCVAQHFSGAWRALQRIPPGETRSDSAIAGQVGNPAAVRAVANACANNPVCLVVPRHRVIGKNGLGGYRWGTERKSGCWPTKWSGRAGRARGLESRSKIAGRHDPHAGMASRHGLTRFQKHVDPTSHDFAATNPTQGDRRWRARRIADGTRSPPLASRSRCSRRIARARWRRWGPGVLQGEAAALPRDRNAIRSQGCEGDVRSVAPWCSIWQPLYVACASRGSERSPRLAC